MRAQVSQSRENRADKMRQSCFHFCQALLDPFSPSRLIESFFVTDSPRITEHGPQWCRDRLPFLSKTFRGCSGDDSCETYFKVLAEILKMHMTKDAFPSRPEGFLADAYTRVEGDENWGAVSVVGKGRFESVKTGKSWDETFIYRFSGFDGQGKIGHWVCIYHDTLSSLGSYFVGDLGGPVKCLGCGWPRFEMSCNPSMCLSNPLHAIFLTKMPLLGGSEEAVVRRGK